MYCVNPKRKKIFSRERERERERDFIFIYKVYIESENMSGRLLKRIEQVFAFRVPPRESSMGYK